MLKGQDIVVLAALMGDGGDGESYLELGRRVCLSASETHAAVRRLQASALLTSDRRLLRHNAEEFLVHGLRYAFPFRPSGGVVRGLATSYAAPVAKDVFATTGFVPVWNCTAGETLGQPFDPLYETAPEAARKDRPLYDRLAVFDMLRGGRLRERQFAEAKLREMMS